jgi:hypothetical protein
MTSHETVQINLKQAPDEDRKRLEEARKHFELIQRAAVAAGTDRLNKVADDALPLPRVGAFGLKMGTAETYRVLPKKLEEEASLNPLLNRWRIEIYGLGSDAIPLGIDLCGDVVLGRSQQDADLDLSEYKAIDHGVSRRHAMLRPSASKLYLIDLGSTNGTRCNSVLVSGARPIMSQDIISLGNLTFQIRVIDQR